MNQSYRNVIFALLLFCVYTTFFLSSCATVPLTGRHQLNLIPDGTMLSMSFQQYDDFLKNHKTVTNTENARMVKRVGEKIQKGVETYFDQQGMGDLLSGYNWDFNLVDSPEINAWCMPGGKVVVYTGLLPVAENEAGLAVVMGHEIAHAIAKHGSERMSQGLMAQMGGVAIAKALEEKPETTRALWMAAFGLGAQYGVMLPFSRLHESEADHLGLIFMAIAGYDPHTAIDFWQRMADQSNGKKPPELLSTHPSDSTRIRDIKKLIPEAMTYYKNSRSS